MDKRIRELVQKFSAMWEPLGFGQKILAGTLMMGLVLMSFMIIQQANDDYVVLYTDMSVPDAANVAARLKENNVKYKVTDGGTTIMVSAKDKNQQILDTASDLEDTVNLDSIPPVASDKVQKEYMNQINIQTIQNALKEIRGIRNVQLIVSRPEKSVFSDNDEAVKASVMLEVEPGFRMREEQVKTIRNLVSHAIPGLMAENVVIADSSGNPLEGPGGILIGGQSEADIRQKTFEEKVAKKVKSILVPLVGKENVQVSVTANLNFDQAESEIHRVIPSGGNSSNPTGLAISTQTQTEEYTGAKKGEGGAAGVESNVPSYQGPDDADSKSSNYKMTKNTTNYETSKEHKKVIYAPGTVERMTVAVVLNKVLTPQETSEIEELVENAAGVDRARGDAISIKGYQFSSMPVDQNDLLAKESEASRQMAFYLQIAYIAGFVLLGLAALFVFYSLFKKPAEGELVEEVEEYVFDEPDTLLEETAIPALEAKLDPEIEHMRESINSMVTTDPEEAARVLITYMKDM